MPSQLWKVPLLLAIARFYQKATTPPNAPALQSETSKYGPTPDVMSTAFMRRLAVLTVGIMWTYSLAESAVIVANKIPSPLSGKVLSLLVKKGHSASSVRITPVWLGGCALVSGGALIRLACYRELGRFFTWDLSIKKDQRLVTTGPYSVVRHPAYSGNSLIALGMVICHIAEGSWFTECGGWSSAWSRALVTVWLGWHLSKPLLLCSRVDKEDKVLRNEFREEWDRYAQQTPHRLVPFVY